MRSNYQYNLKPVSHFNHNHTPSYHNRASYGGNINTLYTGSGFGRQMNYEPSPYYALSPSTPSNLQQKIMRESSSRKLLHSLNQNEGLYHVRSTNALIQGNSVRASQKRDESCQQIMERVKTLQQKVEPLLNERSDQTDSVGMQARIQRSINRLEAKVDEMQKEFAILLEKKILEFQIMMEEKCNKMSTMRRQKQSKLYH